jgi:uncharacterized protein (TIGR02284 family)
MDKPDAIVVLNRLVQTCREGQEGFRTAAENVLNTEYRRLFYIFSQQRAQFVSELESEVHRLGGEPVEHGRVASWFERGWMRLKAAIDRGDESGIVSECQSSEEAVVLNYEEALEEDLPLDVQYVVRRQYMDIKDARDRLRILQRAA